METFQNFENTLLVKGSMLLCGNNYANNEFPKFLRQKFDVRIMNLEHLLKFQKTSKRTFSWQNTAELFILRLDSIMVMVSESKSGGQSFESL